MKVLVGVSNRHVHLTRKDLDKLFEYGYNLTKIRDLVQPGQFACKETVTIKSFDGQIEDVRIIGPVRNYTQVEIAKTDAIHLKINPPIRDSGDIENSEPIIIIGPKGTVYKKEGCILANRHIHITPQIRTKLGLDGIDEVKIKISGDKGAILDHVVLKVLDKANLELHLDTDDANSNLVETGDYVEVIIDKK